MQNIATDGFAAETNPRFLSPACCRVCFSLVHLHLVQLRNQHFSRERPVLVLAAFILALDHGIGRQVCQADGRVGFIHLLSPRTTCPTNIFTNRLGVIPFNINRDAVVEFRSHIHRRK